MDHQNGKLRYLENYKVVVLLTPFHLFHLIRICDLFHISLKGATFFYTSYVDLNKIKENFGDASYFSLPEGQISFDDFLRNPIIQIFKLRGIFRKYKTAINQHLVNKNQDENCEIFIFSEKNIFTQFVIERVKSTFKNTIINSVEEGIGFYIKLGFVDKLLTVIYPPLSQIIFGHKLDYYKTLGVHKDINNVYSRFPSYLPYKSEKIRYFQIPPPKDVKGETNATIRKKILLLTSPLSEDRRLSFSKEKELFRRILECARIQQLDVTIKLHPRENPDKFKDINHYKFNFLDQKYTSETINYFKYSHIVNFGSSAVLDILGKGFPADRIVTFDVFSVVKDLAFFRDTIVLDYKSFRHLPI